MASRFNVEDVKEIENDQGEYQGRNENLSKSKLKHFFLVPPFLIKRWCSWIKDQFLLLHNSFHFNILLIVTMNYCHYRTKHMSLARSSIMVPFEIV